MKTSELACMRLRERAKWLRNAADEAVAYSTKRTRHMCGYVAHAYRLAAIELDLAADRVERDPEVLKGRRL